MIISPSPPPPSAPRTDGTPTPNPHIASLKAIFPDFDDAVILSVLESTNYDHDRALDVLLGMNDPSFVPPNPPPPTQAPNQLQFTSAPSVDAQRLSQEALDEQFARRLALEEQQQAAAQTWQPQAMEGLTMYQPYQSRRGGRNGGGGQPQTQGQGGRDTMTEFQEGFNRIAESGKKTFSSIVSRVKAKMQEFDQGQGWTGSQNSRAEQSGLPAPATSYAPGPQQGPGQGAYAQPYQPAWGETTERQTNQSRTSPFSLSPPRSGVSRPPATDPVLSANPQPSSYYDPNARGYDLYDDEEEIQMNVRTTPENTATTQSSVTPPHVDKPATPPPSSRTSSPPLPASVSPVSVPPPTTPPARSFSPTLTGAKGTTPGTPGTPSNVDFSKLGLLPKRPISLVRPQSPPTTGASPGTGTSVSAPRVVATHSHSPTDSSTDTEEPEFIENPFEDQK